MKKILLTLGVIVLAVLYAYPQINYNYQKGQQIYVDENTTLKFNTGYILSVGNTNDWQRDFPQKGTYGPDDLNVLGMIYYQNRRYYSNKAIIDAFINNIGRATLRRFVDAGRIEVRIYHTFGTDGRALTSDVSLPDIPAAHEISPQTYANLLSDLKKNVRIQYVNMAEDYSWIWATIDLRRLLAGERLFPLNYYADIQIDPGPEVVLEPIPAGQSVNKTIDWNFELVNHTGSSQSVIFMIDYVKFIGGGNRAVIDYDNYYPDFDNARADINVPDGWTVRTVPLVAALPFTSHNVTGLEICFADLSYGAATSEDIVYIDVYITNIDGDQIGGQTFTFTAEEIMVPKKLLVDLSAANPQTGYYISVSAMFH